jgi:hypothetical protein
MPAIVPRAYKDVCRHQQLCRPGACCSTSGNCYRLRMQLVFWSCSMRLRGWWIRLVVESLLVMCVDLMCSIDWQASNYSNSRWLVQLLNISMKRGWLLFFVAKSCVM